MSKKPEVLLLSPKFAQALLLANEFHGNQTRKGSRTPYISHLMSVSSLVMEFGGSEDQAIAGLLHDALEDAPNAHEAARREDQIRAEFGNEIAEMIGGCTDGRPGDDGEKAPWKERKQSYLAAMADKPSNTLLVVGCDKLHNLGCTVRDLRREGCATLERFNAGADGLAWYFGEIGRILNMRGIPVADDYAKLMDEFRGML